MVMGPRTSYNQIQGSIMCILWSRELMTGTKFLGPYAIVRILIYHLLPGPARQSPPPPSKLFCTGPPSNSPPPPPPLSRKIAGSNVRSSDYQTAPFTTTPRFHIVFWYFLSVSKCARLLRCSIHLYRMHVNIKTQRFLCTGDPHYVPYTLLLIS